MVIRRKSKSSKSTTSVLLQAPHGAHTSEGTPIQFLAHEQGGSGSDPAFIGHGDTVRVTPGDGPEHSVAEHIRCPGC